MNKCLSTIIRTLLVFLFIVAYYYITKSMKLYADKFIFGPMQLWLYIWPLLLSALILSSNVKRWFQSGKIKIHVDKLICSLLLFGFYILRYRIPGLYITGLPEIVMILFWSNAILSFERIDNQK